MSKLTGQEGGIGLREAESSNPVHAEAVSFSEKLLKLMNEETAVQMLRRYPPERQQCLKVLLPGCRVLRARYFLLTQYH